MRLEEYKYVQDIAKKVHAHLGGLINAESTELSVAKKAAEMLAEYGAPETWYHDVPAFVLLGTRSCLSVSGREYIPATEPVGEINLVTVDLSPKVGTVWGDCARSYVVENGVVTDNPSDEEFVEGLNTERKLHRDMIEFVQPGTRFCDLFEYGNDLIKQYGYQNLGYL